LFFSYSRLVIKKHKLIRGALCETNRYISRHQKGAI
jgi:hypothetical protein